MVERLTLLIVPRVWVNMGVGSGGLFIHDTDNLKIEDETS